MSSTCSILATNSLLCSGGITQPFTFQGLSSFFLEPRPLLHAICNQHISILPSYLPEVLTTIWQNLLAVCYNKVSPISLQYRHLPFWCISGLTDVCLRHFQILLQ